MQILPSPKETNSQCLSWRKEGLTVGFVPTMGYLHDGHLCLVQRSKSENDRTVASIFVNPTQFGPSEDLARYPRDMDRDIGLLQQEGVDLLFAPGVSDMYPEGASTFVEVHGVSETLCGASRPGHFRGVATVVAKLFNIVQSDRSYFGQKDYQQTVVIRKMVADLNIPTEVIVCPTIRENDGLAMSSRNTYLDGPARAAASGLILALREGESAIQAGERDPDRVKERILLVLNEIPALTIDYVEVADAQNLNKMDYLSDKKPVLLALAVKLAGVRLIDNLVVHKDEP